jgi:hypothetical protein
MQGYLFKKKKQVWSMFSGDVWESHFFVLTNVGILVFAGDNFLNPMRLVALNTLQIEAAKKEGKKDFVLKLVLNEDETWTLAAPDRLAYDKWMKSIKDIL